MIGVGARMPVGFVGHGSPMSVLDEAKGALWRAWGASLPRPRAILAVSAHWEDAPVTIGRVHRHAELLYDFYGFPEEMYRLRYPAPGAPELAERVAGLLDPQVEVAWADRPVDHGAWVPLLHMWPEADVPVLQISMPRPMTEAELYGIGSALAPLRDEGVFILATGNLVHDLRGASFFEDEPPPGYVPEFDQWVAEVLSRGDHDALVAWRERAPEPRRAHPTAEHYRPILVAAGAAGGDVVGFPIEGFENRTVSRRCVRFG